MVRIMGSHGGSRAGGSGGGGSDRAKAEYKGDISFENMMKLANEKKLDTISFNKGVTVLPNKFIPESGRKKDLASLVEKYDINETVINMYRDKSGANDLQRMKDLGFEIQAQTLGTAQPGSALPPRDYYYMIRTRKLTPTTDNSPKTKPKARKAKKDNDNEPISAGTSREQRRIARVSRQQRRAQKYGRPKGSQ